jgi:putative ABC transport system ATP-binding protein
MSLIKVSDIEKSYYPGGQCLKVLKGISFEIEKSDFVSIMGPSGSGKSTLMHILGALDRPSSGSYFLDGNDISTCDDKQMSQVRNRRIGFVFQAFYLLAQNTVLENVLLPSLYRGHNGNGREMRERAVSLVEAVGLADRMNFYPNQLSGGQCQRVAIARALFADPPIIMADEPTGNLDTKTGTEIMQILQELNNSGKTVLMVTHEHEISRYGKRVLHLRDGLIEKWETV